MESNYDEKYNIEKLKGLEKDEYINWYLEENIRVFPLATSCTLYDAEWSYNKLHGLAIQ